MSTPSSSALSHLINDSPLSENTLLELLRFRQLNSGNLALEMSQSLGDEVMTYLASERNPDCVGGETTAISQGDALEDAPYLQFL
jgi:hypothetical protein